jgi:hypothetical protein
MSSVLSLISGCTQTREVRHLGGRCVEMAGSIRGSLELLTTVVYTACVHFKYGWFDCFILLGSSM